MKAERHRFGVINILCTAFVAHSKFVKHIRDAENV